MLKIWTNTRMPAQTLSRLRSALVPNQLLVSGQTTGILNSSGPDSQLAEADIAFGQPDPDQILTLNRLKWIHLSTAGYTRYDRADLREFVNRKKILVTNSSSVFDEPCAEQVLAYMLAAARDFPTAFANQLGPRAWPGESMRDHSRLLVGQTALLLGFGAIGRRLAELLQPFRMNVHGLRRTPRPIEPIPVHPMTELDRLLPTADQVVNILPASPSTHRIINAEKFSLMKPGAIFHNIGRGTTVDQAALIDALKSGQVAAAYLDVTDPEPLPPDDPLWRAPNCVITPHTGGGHFNEYERGVDHFLENLRRFEARKQLRDQIL